MVPVGGGGGDHQRRVVSARRASAEAFGGVVGSVGTVGGHHHEVSVRRASADASGGVVGEHYEREGAPIRHRSAKGPGGCFPRYVSIAICLVCDMIGSFL